MNFLMRVIRNYYKTTIFYLYMRQKTIFIIFIFILSFGACSTEIPKKDLSDKSDLFEILMTNPDAKEYLEAYPNSQIIEIKTINDTYINSIINTTSFLEVYANLPSDKTIVEVLINGGSSLSLLAHIDQENYEIYSVVGLFQTRIG